MRFLERAFAVKRSGLIQADAERALDEIVKRFNQYERELTDLEAGSYDPATIATHCDLVLGDLFRFMPLLGFLHRSKSSANPFEIYGPLRALARRLLQSDTRLIVSSEWAFSPFTMPHGSLLTGFVFIGMPASEADNALLVPLAGHEFGHSVWAGPGGLAAVGVKVEEAVWQQVRARIQEFRTLFSITADETQLSQDMDTVRAVAPARRWALEQAQELFCDIFGLRTFGESYLHAFSYFLAPGLGSRRPPEYPHPRDRAEALVKAATQFAVAVPTGFAEAFTPPTPRAPSRETFLAVVADDAARDVVPLLINRADECASQSGVSLPEDAKIGAIIRDCFDKVVPADFDYSLPELVCSGWRASENPSMWASLPHVHAERERILNDLLLHSAQILEYHHRLLAPGA